MPLVDAAAALRLPYRVVWDAVLSGRLDGHREAGRWVVTARSVERLARGAPAAGAAKRGAGAE
jgi:hypothetical protein